MSIYESLGMALVILTALLGFCTWVGLAFVGVNALRAKLKDESLEPLDKLMERFTR